MIPSVLIGLFYQDGGLLPFGIGILTTALLGIVGWSFTRKTQQELKLADGFITVALFWLVLSLFGSIPLVIAEHPHLFTDSVFETVSGLTTTGAEIFSDLDQLPHSVRYYHQQLQLFGGMSIIVLAVAIAPILGIGGAQLFKAETPGSIKDSKLTPRLEETAKNLWYIYLTLIILCALSYWLAGMTLFDAVGESFATISTGGLTMHNSNFAFYHTRSILWISSFYMILGATNFSLHFTAFKKTFT